MKLLARLLSHGFAVALVVLLAIGFVYRGELFPEWELPDFLAFDSAESTADDTPAGKIERAPIQEEQLASGPATGDQQASSVEDTAPGIEDTAAGAMPPVEEMAESGAPVMTESAPVDASEAVEASEAEMPAAPAVEEDTPAVEAPVTTIEAVEEPFVLEGQESVEEAAPPVPEATADVSTETVSEDAGIVPPPAAVTAGDDAAESASLVVVEEMEVPAPALAPEAVTAPDVAGIAAPEPVAASEEAAQDPASQVEADEAISYYQMLASAREAYWLRDYQTAEGFYRRMIADDPDNPDGYGELANMYFNQGNWEAAASAYYEAGSRLVKSGLLAPARELVDVIRGLNGPQADALEQEVQAAHESL